MDTITISATVSYNSQTTAGTVTLQAKQVMQGELTATTTYALVAGFATDEGQAIVLTNGGSVDVSVRLKFPTTKYATFTIPSNSTVVLPCLINVNESTPVYVEDVYVKTVSGTADVTYIIVY